MATITTKEEFIRLSNEGKLGNRLQSWKSIVGVVSSGYDGFVAVRSKNKADARYTKDFIHVDSIYHRIFPESVYFQETPSPNTIRRINFEAWLGPRYNGDTQGLSMYCEEFTKNAVRGIRERGELVHKLRSKFKLKSTLSEDSYEMLMDIWDRYPTSIIEATEFLRPVGVLHQKLVIWEVRDY